MGAIRLTVLSDHAEAEVVCGMLRAEGIQCFHRTTDLTGHLVIAAPGGWREILVNEPDLPRARELLEATEPSVETCARCGHEIAEDGGWYRDEAGELAPYCAVCAERLFGPF